MEQAYYSVKEMSEYTGVKEPTLYKWVKEKKIPHTRMNGLIRFHIDTINKWLGKRQIQPKKIIA